MAELAQSSRKRAANISCANNSDRHRQLDAARQKKDTGNTVTEKSSST
jgi:hypothetical protein